VSSEPKPEVLDTSRDYTRGQDGLRGHPFNTTSVEHRSRYQGNGDTEQGLPLDSALRHVRHIHGVSAHFAALIDRHIERMR
jgi:hypothetical protein